MILTWETKEIIGGVPVNMSRFDIYLDIREYDFPDEADVVISDEVLEWFRAGLKTQAGGLAHNYVFTKGGDDG